MGIDDIKKAQRVIDAYVERPPALSGNLADNWKKDCESICNQNDFTEEQCKIFSSDVCWPLISDQKIHSGDCERLEKVGFDKDFIDTLANASGTEALRNTRIRWLSDHMVTKWYRPDFTKSQRMGMMTEFAQTPNAPAKKEAIPTLVALLKDKDEEISGVATLLLRNIGPEATLTLMEALKDENPHVRRNAASSLDTATDPIVIPALEKMAKTDPNQHCREVAQQTLERVVEKFR